MRLVLDVSVVLPIAAFTTPEAQRIRDKADRLLDGDPAHIIEILTPLEVLSALRRLELSGEIDSDWAATVHRRSFGWPYKRERLTQPLIERIWELRRNFTPYDAAYLAATEALQATHKEQVALLTADSKLANAPPGTMPCQIIDFRA